jgi:thiol-disulfide isomerase/thioredoxin
MKKTFCLFTALFLLSGFTVFAQIIGVKKPDIKSLPDIDVYDLNGKHISLKELAKNKVIFIDNWFIPCPQCFIEMNILHKLYTKYAGNKDFCFVTISRTDSGVVKKFIAHDPSMQKYVNSYQFFSRLDYFKLPVYFIPGCNAKVVMAGKSMHDLQPDDPTKCSDDVFTFSGYPTVLVFDKQGNVIFKKTGYDGKDVPNMAEIENVIRPALAAN